MSSFSTPPIRFNNTPTPPPRLHDSPNAPTPLSITRLTTNQSSPRSDSSLPLFTRHPTKNPPLLRPCRTHPMVWCYAIICLVLSLLLILLGVATLIIYMVIRPKYPSFDVSNARLNAIYFDSPVNFNGDFTLLANFTNPNRKMDISFDYIDIELYFVNRLIATQALEPIRQRPGEGRLLVVHMISSLVYLPPTPAIELQRQVQSNRVKYNIKGSFRVTATIGAARFRYWLYSRCQLEMTSPPTGFLVARNCTTKR